MRRNATELKHLAERLDRFTAAAVLRDLVEHCYATGVFDSEGQALALVDSTIGLVRAGGFADLVFNEHNTPGGLRTEHYFNLSPIALGSLLCLTIAYLLQRKFLGATQIRLITRDCEHAIAGGLLHLPA